MNLEQVKDSIKSGPGQIMLVIRKKEKTLKKNRVTKLPFDGEVLSRKVITAFIGFKYQEEVNIRREVSDKEPDFIANALPWGQWMEEPYFISHREKIYLRVYYPETIESKEYFMMGQQVPYDLVKDILPPPPKESNSRQGLESPVELMSITIDNISDISIQLPF